MQFRSYNQECKFALCQIIDVFNNLLIYRFNKQNQITETIKVPCVYGGRSRILKSAENANMTLQPPITTFVTTNIQRDKQRVHSSMNSFAYNDSSNKNNPIVNVGLPITITYKFSILTKFQEDADQIISNFAVHFNPDIYVVWPSPYGTGNIKSQITWDGNIATPDEKKNELKDNEKWRIEYDLTFTYKTWLFPGMALFDGISGNIIDKINVYGYSGLQGSGEDRWYVAPTVVNFDSYKNFITSGMIDLDATSDLLPMVSGNCNYLSGQTFPAPSGV